MTERAKEILEGIATMIVAAPLAFGAMVVVGMVIDGMGESMEQRERCQRHAPTPYEYHQCR
jgi:hypothetical protein